MAEKTGSLAGKKALIVGVLNKRSLAWGIAQKLHAEGARIALTYQNERFEAKVGKIADEVDTEFMVQCDLTKDDELQNVAKTIEEKWGEVDIVIHSVAYADAKNLQGRLMDVSAENYAMALDISAYTLISLSRAVEPLLTEGASIIALSYYGAHKVFPGYHLMGVAKAALEAIVRYAACELGESKKVRVNAISAGAVKTLAASGVPGIQSKLDMVEEKGPIRENITNEDVGDLAAFLCSDGSKRITGSTMYVDSGMNILGQ